MNANSKHRSVKVECKTMFKKYKVKPGSSWGSMNVEQQNKWMSLRCDAYFCKPDKLESKGVYKCIELKLNHTESGIDAQQCDNKNNNKPTLN